MPDAPERDDDVITVYQAQLAGPRAGHARSHPYVDTLARADLDTRSKDRQQELTARERAVINMLAAGLKHEAAAARLGVSVRTIDRYVESVKRKLSASSQFQAGLLAARQGWI